MPLRWASAYWPYYQNPKYRELFPIIEAIDNALWGAYLQEIAQTHGQSWPHKGCGSIDLSARLPCEMLIAGIAAQLTDRRELVFNTNRLDLIWPEDSARFRQRSWHPGEREYLDVQRYGGILLLRPLFSEFGVPKALAYVAQTPFRVEDDNMRVSALRYQERARQALEVMQMAGVGPRIGTGSPCRYRPTSLAIVALSRWAIRAKIPSARRSEFPMAPASRACLAGSLVCEASTRFAAPHD